MHRASLILLPALAMAALATSPRLSGQSPRPPGGDRAAFDAHVRLFLTSLRAPATSCPKKGELDITAAFSHPCTLGLRL